MGASAWDVRNVPVDVTVIGRDGSKQLIAKLSANQKSTELSIPEDSSLVTVRAAGFSSEIQLPIENYSKAVIDTTIRVEGRHDFYWALGAKREPRIVAIDSTISNVELAQPEFSVRKLLGEPVKTSNGTNIGKIEDIRMGPTGEIESFLVKEKTGRIKKLPAYKIERVNSELILRDERLPEERPPRPMSRHRKPRG